jgi:hypothetical protein
MEASDDDESVDRGEEDRESDGRGEEEDDDESDDFEFDDDVSVEPVPEAADLVDQDGNPVHQRSIDRVVAYLGGEGDEDKEDSHNLHDAVKRIHLWPEPSFDLVVQKARSSPRLRVALQPGLFANSLSAERASVIVSSMSNLRHLQLIDNEKERYRTRIQQTRCADYIKTFVRRFAVKLPVSPRLSCLDISLDCPMDPTALSDLLRCQGGRLEAFTFVCLSDGVLDRDIASALGKGLQSMIRIRNLHLDLYANRFTPGILFQRRFGLEKLDITLHFAKSMSSDDDTFRFDDDSDYGNAKEVSDPEIFRVAAENVTHVVRCSHCNLRTFALKCTGHDNWTKRRFDGIHLLDSLVGARLLEDLSFKSIDLSDSDMPAREPGQRNTSLTTVRLHKCVLGPVAFALLSECVAITTLEMRGCDDLPCYESWKALLQGMRGLRTFSVTPRSTWDGAYCIGDDSIVRAIVEDVSPKVDTLELELDEKQKYGSEDEQFPSIQQLILARTGALKLKLRCPIDRNLAYLCDGIKFTRTLACLDLNMPMHALPSHCVSVVFSSIARNVSLRRATLVFKVQSYCREFELLPCCAPFTAMIRENSTLEFLALEIVCWEVRQGRDLEALLPALVEGLEHNRTLRSIHFLENDHNPISPSLSRSLVEVLKRPGVRLKTIKGLSYESAADNREIEYLCTTRYARMVLDCPAEYSSVLMPHILSKLTVDGPDCVRYFLNRMPRHFFGSNLRRRGRCRARGTAESADE